ncbi:MAG TPA: PIN domain-containing protein [Sedimentisphaerales bacterium]|nr:PIN domain-containing protein [Sedimentisphaerales bacterium]
MYVFLLDTCIWSYWFDVKREKNLKVKSHIQKLPSDSILGISIISWGEVVYGHKVESPNETPIQAEYIQFIKSKRPKTFEIDIHTANKYGEIRALLFEKYAPKIRKPGLRPEQLIDPVTSRELGIQENDLWIAAQAMVRNMTLATDDKLSRIREVAGDELHIENWTT